MTKPVRTLLLIILSTLLSVQASAAQNYAQRDDVRSYINTVVKKYQYDRKTLESLIGSAVKQDRTIELLDTPAEKKPWYEYREIFITDKRIAGGVSFWNDNDALLKKVSQHYQVPAELIVALVGIETFYGDITGRFPVLDTLVTLGFDYPRRSKFFRSELTQFLLLCRGGHVDCRKTLGSHGGAMGTGQFISSSYRNYAVDFDHDGKRDLWGSKADILASVANYIARHGWVKGAPIADLTNLPAESLAPILNKNLKPWLTTSKLASYEVDTKSFKPQAKSFTLLGMMTDDEHTDVWAAYQNFYVITRYNHSRLYALAVYELSQAIKEERKR